MDSAEIGKALRLALYESAFNFASRLIDEGFDAAKVTAILNEYYQDEGLLNLGYVAADVFLS